MKTTNCSKKPGELCRLHNPAPHAPAGLLSQKDFFEPKIDPAQLTFNEFLAASEVNFEDVKKWFFCDSRLSGDELKLVLETRNPNLSVKTCTYCGQLHQFREEGYDDTYWIPKIQFIALRGYIKDVRAGKVVGKVAENIIGFDKPNAKVDILLKGARAYYDDIKMGRAELLTWYQCERKFSFSDLPSASKEAARLSARQGKCESYKCLFCPWYHIGRPNSGSEKYLYRNAHKTYLEYLERRQAT